MGINIPLIDNWRIRTDKYNYILIREDSNREFSEGYYNSFQGCVQAFVDKKIKGFDATSILGLVNSIKSLQTALNKALSPLNVEVRTRRRAEGEEQSSLEAFNDKNGK